MNYQNRVVLFLDILGFKNILDKTLDKEEQDDTKRINQLHETLSLMYNEVSWKKSSKETSRVVTQFSDTIVVSFLENDKAEVVTFFDDVLSLLTQLVSRGILCRGAVSYGKLVHSDRIIFGPALVDAYLTESKAAMYPRVILDRTLVETIREAKEPYFRKLFEQDEFYDAYLKKDLDEKLYFDYILSSRIMLDQNDYVFGYLQTLRKMIIDGQKFKSPDIKVKYGWLKNKFNSAIEKLHKNPSAYGVTERINITQLHKTKTIG
ncbi:MAG: hypothetical protein JST58_04010 [Bacteroidetes bacterium]|nr:hypothetical protein [Bacteroidota bacterium]